MSKIKVAALTGALLAPKGHATPAGIVAPWPGKVRRPATRTLRIAGATHTPCSHGDSGRVKLSLRLGAERHLRLRLAAAHLRKSLQDVLTHALDAYLDRVAPVVARGHCDCLAKRNIEH